ncbi:hypothetical protein RND71_023766 [Anisodus tanguticus]|uniref:Uncharacterized protein n=1 Tax=Anisodus tanguticus TaxID=243964 RepID=A0AAE1RUH7_9SOLA|nr:hypothetical protein RND71_023766 [Anisodus tanguticus]
MLKDRTDSGKGQSPEEHAAQPIHRKCLTYNMPTHIGALRKNDEFMLLLCWKGLMMRVKESQDLELLCDDDNLDKDELYDEDIVYVE